MEINEHVHIFNYPCSDSTTCHPISITLFPGFYVFELYGAAGGDVEYDGKISKGGRGGYTRASLKFFKKTKAYLYIGGKGGQSNTSYGRGGYNGGGNGSTGQNHYPSAGGGGSTDIRIGCNNERCRYIVAGGGGGAGCSDYDLGEYKNYGGAGGGIQGINGIGVYQLDDTNAGIGGNQTHPGRGGMDPGTSRSVPSGSFFFGGSFEPNGGKEYLGSCGGGGSGYFGGGAGSATGGSGGSGYFHPDCNSYPNYPPTTIAGNTTFPTPDGKNEIQGNPSNGIIKISVISIKTIQFTCKTSRFFSIYPYISVIILLKS